jgi:ATP-dependent Clp protease, protease subunit
MVELVSAWVHEFEDDEIRKLQQAIELAREQEQPVLPVYIASFGGNVHVLMAMADLMQSSGLTVATVALGAAYSCGAVLLSAGTRGHRFVGPNAQVMVHDTSVRAPMQKNADTQVWAKQVANETEALFSMLDKHTSKRRGYWRRELQKRQNVDMYFGAGEAVRHGLADHVGVPRITTQAQRKVTIECR